MRVDFKETVWYQMSVPKKHEKAVLKALKEGKITDATDLIDFLGDLGEDVSGEHNLETSEQMFPNDIQDGQATIECFKEKNDDDRIWSNEEKPRVWDAKKNDFKKK
jgi:hypothetical protein